MDIFTLLILGAFLAIIPIAIFFGLVFLALLTYVVSHVYPWLKRLAKLCAKPENLFSFLILAVVLIILVIIMFMLLRSVLILLLIFPPLLLFIPVDLGLIVWLVRIIKWLFAKWKSWLVSIYATANLQIIRMKIKHDVKKDTDLKAKWQGMKDKLSAEADRARGKINRRK
ncbi:MAG: hypothetical protein FJ004_04030 [Chloroflexi bacterium]|nr:hypothetical protein [Chloroflexota bacterium]